MSANQHITGPRMLAAVAALVAVGAVGCTGSGGSGGSGGGDTLLSAGREDYTIQLYKYMTPDHFRNSAKGRNAAGKLAGLRGVFVVHEDHASTLYCGRYRSIAAAQADLKRAKDWQSPSRLRPFQSAIITPYPGREPGRPEHDLKSAPGMYTVLIETYYNDPNKDFHTRKETAVKRVEELRQNGEQAYYYHGPANSMVTIGSFPGSAVTIVKEGAVNRQRIVDPQIRRILTDPRHQYLLTNGTAREFWYGDVHTRDFRPRSTYRPSYVVRIPGRGEEQTDGRSVGRRRQGLRGFGDWQPR